MILRELLELLESIKPIYQNQGKGANCVVYKYVPVMSNGAIGQNRLEITVNNENYETALEKLEEIKSLLITKGAEFKSNNILEIALNGGGYLYDTELNTHSFKAIFIVKNIERMR